MSSKRLKCIANIFFSESFYYHNLHSYSASAVYPRFVFFTMYSLLKRRSTEQPSPTTSSASFETLFDCNTPIPSPNSEGLFSKLKA